MPVARERVLYGMLTAKDIIRIQPELLETFKVEPEDEPTIVDGIATCDICGKETNILYHIDGLNVCNKCYEEYVKKRKY